MSAQANYRRLWKRVGKKFYGGGRMPELIDVQRGGGYAYTLWDGDTPQRRVYASPQYFAAAANESKEARFATLHEWGHACKGFGEGKANRVANKASRWLNRRGIEGF